MSFSLQVPDQGRDDGPVLGAAIGAGKKGILPVEGDGTDGALDSVVVELNAAVIDQACQALPTRQRIADGIGKLALLADQAEFCA